MEFTSVAGWEQAFYETAKCMQQKILKFTSSEPPLQVMKHLTLRRVGMQSVV